MPGPVPWGRHASYRLAHHVPMNLRLRQRCMRAGVNSQLRVGTFCLLSRLFQLWPYTWPELARCGSARRWFSLLVWCGEVRGAWFFSVLPFCFLVGRFLVPCVSFLCSLSVHGPRFAFSGRLVCPMVHLVFPFVPLLFPCCFPFVTLWFLLCFPFDSFLPRVGSAGTHPGPCCVLLFYLSLAWHARLCVQPLWCNKQTNKLPVLHARVQ